MSKVVHLSDDAHALAKKHCQAAGMKMSEWVAALIASATKPPMPPARTAPTTAGRAAVGRVAVGQAMPTSPAQSSAPQAATVDRRPAQAATPAAGPAKEENDLLLYAAPPFWARSGSNEACNHAGK